MSTYRTQRFIAVGLTVTVSLFLLVLAVRVGLAAAATGTSGVSTSGDLKGKVRIHCKGTLVGPQGSASGRGRFTLSGAISDRGRFVDGHFQGFHPEIDPHVRTLFGAKGTIRISVDVKGSWRTWRITKGTKAYAGLRGRGRESGAYGTSVSGTIDVAMKGTVSK